MPPKKTSSSAQHAIHESMTGYAVQRKTFAEHDIESGLSSLSIELELQSINSRYLEIHWRADRALHHFEIAARQRLKQSFMRGRLTLTMTLQVSSAASPQSLYSSPDPHDAAQQSILSQMNKWQEYILQRFPHTPPLSVYEWLKLLNLAPSSLSAPQWSPSHVATEALHLNDIFHQEKMDESLIKLLDNTIVLLQHARQLEAKNILPIMRNQAKALHTHLAKIIDSCPHETERLTQKVVAQLNALKMDMPVLDQSRLTQEAALLLIRHDIGEEIERLRSHLKTLDILLSAPPVNTLSIGKSLDFLMQELNREVNTIASKTTSTLVSQCTMSMKLTIDKIREQAQNLQ